MATPADSICRFQAFLRSGRWHGDALYPAKPLYFRGRLHLLMVDWHGRFDPPSRRPRLSLRLVRHVGIRTWKIGWINGWIKCHYVADPVAEVMDAEGRTNPEFAHLLAPEEQRIFKETPNGPFFPEQVSGQLAALDLIARDVAICLLKPEEWESARGLNPETSWVLEEMFLHQEERIHEHHTCALP